MKNIYDVFLRAMAVLKKIIHYLLKIKHWLMGNYPLSKYHFHVEWGGKRIGFTEISGLSIEFTVIEHRDGSSPEYSAVKMPGMRKFTNIVLKRGLVKDDKDFIDWVNTIQLNAVERRDLVISLLDETHSPVMAWKIKNAWPCKYQVSDFNASGNEVMIETIELAHEGLQVLS
jgi:phage tail-like protein